MESRLDELTREFVANRRQLLAFVGGVVRNPQAAEEIVQEVWLRLADAVQRDVQIEHVDRWCRGVAKNLILHHFRNEQRARVVADSRLLDLADLAFEENDDFPAEQQSRRLRNCLERLPQHAREMLRLKYEAGLKFAEIARRLSRTEDAVMKALSRIRQMLAECIEKQRHDEQD